MKIAALLLVQTFALLATVAVAEEVKKPAVHSPVNLDADDRVEREAEERAGRWNEFKFSFGTIDGTLSLHNGGCVNLAGPTTRLCGRKLKPSGGRTFWEKHDKTHNMGLGAVLEWRF